MQAEDLGTVVADHKALQLLLVHGEGASFDVEVASSREAEHVLTLGVPGHTVGIRFLRDRDGGNYHRRLWHNSYTQSSSLFKA